MELLLFKPTPKEIFALNVHKVREVLTTPEITAVPNAGAGVVGMISIRGDIIPVIDLAARLDLVDDASHAKELCIIVECMRKTVALLVHNVHRIITVTSSELQDANEKGLQGSYIEAILKTSNDDKIVAVLDLEALYIDSWGTDLDDFHENINVDGDKRLILCVDDSGVARKSLTRALTGLGFEVEILSSARDALTKAKHCEHDLKDKYLVWLIDAEMPGMDGFELIDELKKLPKAEDLRLVVLTSMSGDAINERSLKVGADDCMVKFDIQSLASKLKAWKKQ